MPVGTAKYRFSLLAACAALVGLFPAPAAAQETMLPRRIFLLHSGLHTILSEAGRNNAAEKLEKALRTRGVDPRDIVVLDSPFPAASWTSMFPLKGISTFLESISPKTKVSQDAYLRVHEELRKRGVGPRDGIVWIGHSAGGQMGLTLANLAGTLSEYPELEKKAGTYRFDMVVTLGSPLGPCKIPAGVRLRTYWSPEDRIVKMAAQYGRLVTRTFGNPVKLGPLVSLTEGNTKVRVFLGIEHPAWDEEARVVDRVLAELRKDTCPAWHSALAIPQAGLSLSQLLCHALDHQCNLSLEDPPR